MALSSDQLAKLQSVVSDRPSKWRENARFRAENKDWLKNSQSTAFMILEALSDQKITQKDLAEKLGVSPQQVNKWVKGRENFTFETISKLEKALNIKILTIGEPEVVEVLMDTVSSTVTKFPYQSEFLYHSELFVLIEDFGNIRPLNKEGNTLVYNYKG